MADTPETERDEFTGTETTGHEWDGIKELDTPLPRWWLWTFYATIVWGVVYTIAYPAWPLVSSFTGGVLGYSSRGELHAAVAEHEESQKSYLERIAATGMDEIRADADLAQFARAGGAAIYRNYCSQCHGSGATGAKGYPSLQDDDWLWGGTAEDIRHTVAHGIRFESDDDTRVSEMPAFGRDEILSKVEIEAVADHVLSLSGEAGVNPEGAQIYADNCAACHGENGEGVQELGAPRLADGIWLYGGDRESVIATIANSRAGVMPAWSHRMTEAQVKQVALYVHGLGGGQ
ncbi:MAG TPA: cytochrome-c oxidase, cbb3-type subunit III [Thermohalobaculum sp.]|nr:cytochrome-c oxidase, cbb3-type subunit III [Thermohalobaculum sp.]